MMGWVCSLTLNKEASTDPPEGSGRRKPRDENIEPATARRKAQEDVRAESKASAINTCWTFDWFDSAPAEEFTALQDLHLDSPDNCLGFSELEAARLAAIFDRRSLL